MVVATARSGLAFTCLFGGSVASFAAVTTDPHQGNRMADLATGPRLPTPPRRPVRTFGQMVDVPDPIPSSTRVRISGGSSVVEQGPVKSWVGSSILLPRATTTSLPSPTSSYLTCD